MLPAVRPLSRSTVLAFALIAASLVAYALIVTPFAVGTDLFRPASLGVAFLAGLVTGSHCIGMCGGFVLCFAARHTSAGAHLRYAAAKTVSYMAIGAMCGWLGHAVSSTSRWPWVAAIAAGVLLLALGSHLLGWPALPDRFRPAALDRFSAGLRERARRTANPVALGLANGLMLGCGPLLALYAAAAGTGSPRDGALLLGAFGLGTLPVMLASAWLASTVLGNFRRQAARWSGLVVLAGGLLMLQRGIALARSAPLAAAGSTAVQPQIVRMAATPHGWSPDRFTVRQGVPVRWVIDGREASACTARLRLAGLAREIVLGPGETTVEFTPAASGPVTWSCWMGMARGRFDVVAEPPGESTPPP